MDVTCCYDAVLFLWVRLTMEDNLIQWVSKIAPRMWDIWVSYMATQCLLATWNLSSIGCSQFINNQYYLAISLFHAFLVSNAFISLFYSEFTVIDLPVLFMINYCLETLVLFYTLKLFLSFICWYSKIVSCLCLIYAIIMHRPTVSFSYVRYSTAVFASFVIQAPCIGIIMSKTLWIVNWILQYLACLKVSDHTAVYVSKGIMLRISA